MRLLFLTLVCSLAGVSLAQFQFFEQMFNQGGQQQQQRQQQEQNVASDSEWYQKTYEGGMLPQSFSVSCGVLFVAAMFEADDHYSTLHELSLPWHTRLRTLPTSLPLRIPCCRGQSRARRRERNMCEQGRMEGG